MTAAENYARRIRAAAEALAAELNMAESIELMQRVEDEIAAENERRDAIYDAAMESWHQEKARLVKAGTTGPLDAAWEEAVERWRERRPRRG
jgi:hypothetical protein